MPENEGTQLLEAQKEKGMLLAEAWSNMDGRKIRGFERHGNIDFLEGVDNDHERAVLSQLYENTFNWLNRLNESTRTLQVGSFEKFVFPILRALMANLIASELVTVSPLDAPTGLVFYFDVVYGSSKGSIVRGTKMYDVRTGPSRNVHYTDEVIQQEQLGAGDGATAQFGGGAAAFAYTPIRPGTVIITDGTQRVSDDGNGNLVGDIGEGVNTIAYNTGVYDVTFAVVIVNGNAVTATYEYNSEANEGTPEIDLQLTSAPVVARTQKLRARWSLEAQQDFQAYHGINAEVELVAYMANEIAKELNYKIIRHLAQVASSAAITWDRTPPLNVPWIWHKESLYDALIQQSNAIFSGTQRAQGNWIVASVEVCNVIETLSKFQSIGVGSSGLAGVKKIGTLGEFTIFKDPTFYSSEWLMGHKGSSFLDTGYIHAPYLQLFTTDTITLDDMIARKGMGMRSGQKVVNSRMYSMGTLDQSGAAF